MYLSFCLSINSYISISTICLSSIQHLDIHTFTYPLLVYKSVFLSFMYLSMYNFSTNRAVDSISIK